MNKTQPSRVLIVEDEEMVRKFYQQALEKSGFKVSCADCGESAIASVLQQEFDIAIVDLRLEGKLDGLMTYRVLKTVQPQLKGIVITGYTNRQSLLDALRSGVDGWLGKPVTVDNLINAVQEVFQKTQPSSEPYFPTGNLSGLLLPNLVSGSDPDALFRLLLQVLMSTTLSDIGILWVTDRDEVVLSPKVAIGLQVMQIPSNIPCSGNGWMQCLKKELKKVTKNLCLVAPIIHHKDFVGALSIGRRLSSEAFYSESDVHYLERFAEWLAPILFAWRYPINLIGNIVNALEVVTSLLHRFVDPTEESHPQRLKLIVHCLGSALRLSEERLNLLGLAATLHDLGKTFLPVDILNKAAPLTPEERALMQQHPIYGEQILRGSGLPEQLPLWVRWHHERYDGKGYPDKRSGDEIPLEASILAVAEALETMISERPYKPAISFEEALEVIFQERGKQFDPKVVDALKEIADELKFKLEPSQCKVRQETAEVLNTTS